MTCSSGDAFATDSSAFERLQWVANSCERAYRRALNRFVTSTQLQPLRLRGGTGVIRCGCCAAVSR